MGKVHSKIVCDEHQLLKLHIEQLEKQNGGLLYTIAELERIRKTLLEDNKEQKDKVYELQNHLWALFGLIKHAGNLDSYRHLLVKHIEEVIGNEYIRNGQ